MKLIVKKVFQKQRNKFAKLVNEFNKYYTNFVEKSGEAKPLKLSVDANNEEQAIKNMIDSYKNIPSILEINERF